MASLFNFSVLIIGLTCLMAVLANPVPEKEKRNHAYTVETNITYSTIDEIMGEIVANEKKNGKGSKHTVNKR